MGGVLGELKLLQDALAGEGEPLFLTLLYGLLRGDRLGARSFLARRFGLLFLDRLTFPASRHWSKYTQIRMWSWLSVFQLTF